MSDASRRSVAWNDDSVAFIAAPLFKNRKGRAGVHHTRGCEQNHRSGRVDHVPFKILYVFELEHILAFGHKRLLDFLIRPVGEELVIEIGSLCESSRKVNRVLDAGPAPVRLKENSELLGSAERKHWNQNLAAAFEGLMNGFEELSFPRSLGIPN